MAGITPRNASSAEGSLGPASRRAWGLLALLAFLAVLGNVLVLPLIFGLDLLFGTAAALVVGGLFGLRWGTLVAVLAGVQTCFIWFHPWAGLVFTLEVVVTTWLWRRWRLPLVVGDAAYWLGLGIPLVGLTYHGILGMDTTGWLLVAVKDLANGILNAVLASLCLQYLPLERWAGRPDRRLRFSMHEIVLVLLVGAVLVPALGLRAYDGPRTRLAMEEDLALREEAGARLASAHLGDWFRVHRKALQTLADQALGEGLQAPERLQERADLLRTASASFQRVRVVDARGRTRVESPPSGPAPDPRPVRPSVGPRVSAVYADPAGGGAWLVDFSVPLWRGGRFLGVATGALRLADFEGVLAHHVASSTERLTLLDRDSRVVASTAPDLPRGRLYDWSGNGRAEPLRGRLHWRWPEEYNSAMQRWGGSSMLWVGPAVPGLPWTLVVESGLSPLQARVYAGYLHGLAAVSVLALLALAVSWLVSARAVWPVGQLARATSDLPELLKGTQPMLAPESEIEEIEQLSRTYARMAAELQARFGELEERNRELGRTNQALLEEMHQRQALEERIREKQKMEALGLFAGGIAHDFNNLLGGILGHAELASSELPREHLAQEGLARIRESSLRARTLVRQILTFSRKRGRSTAPVDLQAVLTETCAHLRATLPETINLEVRIAPGLGCVRGDADELARVLTNLATHAEHAMQGQERGCLALALDEVTVPEATAGPLGLRGGGRYARLDVSDTGQAVRAEHLPRLFEPFFTTRELGLGTGLGLAMVHGLVHGQGGAVEALGRPGGGTTVRLYLPLCMEVASEPSGPRPPAVVGAAFPRGTERVMVVDDEATLAQLGRMLLGRLGYQVEDFTRPEEALACFQEDPSAWDLVVTDQTMPGMLGTELIRRLRIDRPDLPAILCSGFNREVGEGEVETLRLGAYLFKPVPLGELADAVRRVLDEPRPAPPN